MTSLPSRLRTASALGIITASFLAGSILTPTPASRKNSIRTTTTTTTIALTIVSTFSFTWLSLSLMRSLDQRRGELFALAALVTGIVPAPLPSFVTAAMRSLGVGRDEKEEGEEEEGQGWRWRWNGVLPLVGAVLGAWATLAERL